MGIHYTVIWPDEFVQEYLKLLRTTPNQNKQEPTTWPGDTR